MRSTAWAAVVLFLLTLCGPLATVAGELTTEERLAEQGLTVLALRNDTIDTDQDGDIDAIRVLVVLNSTASQNDLIVKLRGLHKEREVLRVRVRVRVAVSDRQRPTPYFTEGKKGDGIWRGSGGTFRTHPRNRQMLSQMCSQMAS